jgi:hypothetical protein
MISILNAHNQEFVTDLQRVTDQLNSDVLAVSSGVQMRQVSDNPDQVSALLQARATLAASQQISTNLASVKNEVDTGEQALEGAVQLFDQVQTAGAEGDTGTQSASTRTAARAATAEYRTADGEPRQHDRQRAIHFLRRRRSGHALHL